MDYLSLFEPREYKDEFIRIPYRLFIPKIESGEKYPLVLFLHGAGERGDDNVKQIITNEGATTWVNDEFQQKHPCFVLAPQCPEHGYWGSSFRIYEKPEKLMPNSLLLTIKIIIEGLQQEFPIDPDRIYITGLSMGGFGTVSLLMAYPESFAAGVVVCGGGNPNQLHKIVHVPIWFFHAEDDNVVSVEYSRILVKNLQELGGEVKYTEYPTGYLASLNLSPHASWVLAYSNNEMKEWLFSKTRKNIKNM